MVSIGLDIGGTNIACGLIAQDDALVEKRSLPYPGKDAPEASIDVMEALINGLLSDKGLTIGDVCAIGAAVPGSIEYETGHVLDAHNLGYHGFPLSSLLQARFPGTPIWIENDANAAALAEYYCGVFRNHASGLLITLGTGVGGGLILNDRLFVGGRKSGFEFGHAYLQFGGEPCTCGNLGDVESYCSATALIRDGVRAAEANPDCMIAKRHAVDHEKIDAKLIIDCAKAGDEVARKLFDSYVEHLGGAIVSAIAILDPEIVALGGGVSNAGEFLFKPVNAFVKPHAFFRTCADVVPAKMGNDAGIVGAAMLYKQRG